MLAVLSLDQVAMMLGLLIDGPTSNALLERHPGDGMQLHVGAEGILLGLAGLHDGSKMGAASWGPQGPQPRRPVWEETNPKEGFSDGKVFPPSPASNAPLGPSAR